VDGASEAFARSKSKFLQRNSLALEKEKHTEGDGLEQGSKSNKVTEAAESVASKALWTLIDGWHEAR
jgi:hypothetical protein